MNHHQQPTSTTVVRTSEHTPERAPLTQHELPCRTHDPDLWFAEQPHDVEFAKELCRECPLAQVCLDGALERAEPWGVWGGELLSEGRIVARKRGRGRPRKEPTAA